MQVFSYEYCKIFKNTYFEQHLRRASSAVSRFFKLEGPRVELLRLSIAGLDFLSIDRNRNAINLHFLR